MTRSPVRSDLQSAAVRPSSQRSLRLLVGLLLLLLFGGVGFLVLLATASVAGEEFSPDTFQRRSFYYFEIPYFHVQLWPITRTYRTTQLERYLIRAKYVKQTRTAAPRWHVVFRTRTAANARQCDARIFCSYLDTYDGQGEQVWLAWTKAKPTLAKVFWPAVAHVVRRRLYIFVPELFGLAKQARDPASLRRRINETLCARFRRLAEAEQQVGHHQRAVDYFTESLFFVAEDVAARRGRAASLEALGQRGRAASDRAQAGALAATSSETE